MKSHYETLNVHRSATKDEIKKAFRRLAHIHHPDRPGGNVEKFKEINAAYQTLMKLPDAVARPFVKVDADFMKGFDFDLNERLRRSAQDLDEAIQRHRTRQATEMRRATARNIFMNDPNIKKVFIDGKWYFTI